MNNGNGRIDILKSKGNWYKLALHIHSTLSDGKFTPEQLKEMYMAQGYSAIAYTDHRKCLSHTELTDKNFVALTATELDFHNKTENGAVISAVHINALSRDPGIKREYEPMPLDYDLINKTVRDLKDDGFFVTLNHPVWSNMSTEELFKIKEFDAVEVYNSIAVQFNNYSDDSAFYEHFLRNGGRAIPIAADDSHKISDDGSAFVEYFKAFTMVNAEELTYSSLIDSLSAGECFASTGPLFKSIWLEDDILHVECSPVCGIFVHGKYINQKTQSVSKTDSITHAAIDVSKIRENSPYLWVQLRDTRGGKAWAVPFPFNK